MGAFGLPEPLLRSHARPHARQEPLPGEWREQEGLLLAVAAAVLAEARESAAGRQILASVIGRGLLPQLCRDLARTDAGAAGMAALLAARLDSSFLEGLGASAGPPRALTREEETALAEWLRLAAAAAERLLSASCDLRLRASLALAWGRLAKLAGEATAWLEDEDPRVRANAVESLWGRSDEQAVSIFTRKLEDTHQRVAANAAVGLYLAGRAESVLALWKMTRHAHPARRAAAVWAIGRTGDARFLPLLGEMRQMKAASVTLLRNVVLARERIRQTEELPREAIELRLDGIPSQGGFRCIAHLPAGRSESAPPFRPTDFALEINGLPIWDYRAWRSSLSGPSPFSLAVPAPAAELAAQRAAGIIAEAGESAQALFRFALGYDGSPPDIATSGSVFGLSTSSPSGAWLASGSAASGEMLRRAARRLAAESSRARIIVAVERGAPEWLGQVLPASARESASLGISLIVLHEPASLDDGVLGLLRDAGAQAVAVPDASFAKALRDLLESADEAWCIESPGVRAEDAGHVKLLLRSGWFQGQAEAGRVG